jgi:hypothetical protein
VLLDEVVERMPFPDHGGAAVAVRLQFQHHFRPYLPGLEHGGVAAFGDHVVQAHVFPGDGQHVAVGHGGKVVVEAGGAVVEGVFPDGGIVPGAPGDVHAPAAGPDGIGGERGRAVGHHEVTVGEEFHGVAGTHVGGVVPLVDDPSAIVNEPCSRLIVRVEKVVAGLGQGIDVGKHAYGFLGLNLAEDKQ